MYSLLKRYIEIFIGMFRAGMLGYGGGPSSIPLLYKEAVDRFKWLTDEEFSDTLAIGNTLPGPIATKMAGYIGYRVAGIIGLLIAIIATVMPTVILLSIFLKYLYAFKDSGWVNGITTAVQPVIAVMLFVMAYSFMKQSWKGQGMKKTIFLGVISFVLLFFAGLHPAILIGVILLYSFVTGKEKEKSITRGESTGV
ncbi:chromate transporter [Bacillus gobiensis]